MTTDRDFFILCDDCWVAFNNIARLYPAMALGIAVSTNHARDVFHIKEMQTHLHMSVIEHGKETFERICVHRSVPSQRLFYVLVQKPNDRVYRHQAVHKVAGRELMQRNRSEVIFNLNNEHAIERTFPAAYQVDQLALPIKAFNNNHYLDYRLLRDGRHCNSKAKRLLSTLDFLKSARVVKLAISLHRSNHARSDNCGNRPYSLNPGRPVKPIWRYENTRKHKNHDRSRAKCIQRPKTTNVGRFIFHSEILA